MVELQRRYGRQAGSHITLGVELLHEKATLVAVQLGLNDEHTLEFGLVDLHRLFTRAASSPGGQQRPEVTAIVVVQRRGQGLERSVVNETLVPGDFFEAGDF